MTLQQGAVLVLVSLALAYLGRLIVRACRAKDACGGCPYGAHCPSKGTCDRIKPSPPE